MILDLIETINMKENKITYISNIYIYIYISVYIFKFNVTEKHKF